MYATDTWPGWATSCRWCGTWMGALFARLYDRTCDSCYTHRRAS